MMQGIIDLHHDIFFFLILILVFVSRMLVRALWHFHKQTNPRECYVTAVNAIS
ncbi:cytochrome c oxidase subunit 2 [Platanthera guangdongensis]|uniref:Cytochrome c oxidase subunit 2 n=1 Tax=Platanthera guangdongensis TaxID=2320717 RepID=A0ABR2MTS3_9ASPA